MSEPQASRLGRVAAWLFTPALLVAPYFATYYAMVSPVDTRICIRPGSTRTAHLDAPEPTYSGRFQWGLALPEAFWQRFFAPAWRVDRTLRPGVWREKRTDKNP
jgi:hypothetical protein